LTAGVVVDEQLSQGDGDAARGAARTGSIAEDPPVVLFCGCHVPGLAAEAAEESVTFTTSKA
jgi:hypothetical protein